MISNQELTKPYTREMLDNALETYGILNMVFLTSAIPIQIHFDKETAGEYVSCRYKIVEDRFNLKVDDKVQLQAQYNETNDNFLFPIIVHSAEKFLSEINAGNIHVATENADGSLQYLYVSVNQVDSVDPAIEAKKPFWKRIQPINWWTIAGFGVLALAVYTESASEPKAECSFVDSKYQMYVEHHFSGVVDCGKNVQIHVTVTNHSVPAE